MISKLTAELLEDPVKFQRLCWPEMTLYDKQVEILRSLQTNYETLVPAGNELGKDFVAGFAALWFFVSRSPCRVITSSSGQTQLKSVLWGEIRRFIQTSRYPLPIQYNDMLIRQIIDGNVEPRSYLAGIVTVTVENMQGHHLERDGKDRTLAIFDEASGIDSAYYNATDTWAHRKLVIGNPLPCTNFFYTGVKDGDLLDEDAQDGSFYRKIIRIKAEDSPNVRLALEQEKRGKTITKEELIPGVVDLATYRRRRKMWDPIRQCIGLDAEFYEGSELMLFPPDWLNRAETLAASLEGTVRQATSMGIDPAEGGDDTVWTIIYNRGIIEQIKMKTIDTSVIAGTTRALMGQYRLDASQVIFDRGGGGKQHADYLRKNGYKVETVGFGETAGTGNKYLRPSKDMKVDADESRYAYKNRRAQMYGLLSEIMDPDTGKGFGLPARMTELRRQLAIMPKEYDSEGRLVLPPKDKPHKDFKGITIKGILGRSPDQADSTVLAVYGLFGRPKKRILKSV